MDDCFNFESKYRSTGEIKMLNFQTVDGTEWTLKEDWLATRNKPEIFLQRLEFCKENHYDQHYFIKLEVTSVINQASGMIQKDFTTNPISTTITIPLQEFKVFRYSMSELIVSHEVTLCDRVLEDDFRYKVTINRAYKLDNETDNTPISSREKIMIFSDQIHSLLKTGDFSDVILTDGRFQIRAHRNILSARSDFFQNMFQHDMREAKDGIVYIPDIELGILKEMLDYMYSGVLKEIDYPTAYNLFKVADQYQVKGLKKLCCRMIEKRISVDNAVYILHLADKYGEENLKKIALSFVVENYGDIVKSGAWNDVKENAPEWCNEVLSALQVARNNEAEVGNNNVVAQLTNVLIGDESN